MTDGIMITDLRPEIQTLVNSNPKKYDRNRNRIIDEGYELSLLLSEYNCKESQLTSKKRPKHTMLTKEEKRKVSKHLEGVEFKGYIPILTAGAIVVLEKMLECAEAPPLPNKHVNNVLLLGIVIGAGIDLFKRHRERKMAIENIKNHEQKLANKYMKNKLN